jgi:potassium-dependent mechanosensitive channel
LMATLFLTVPWMRTAPVTASSLLYLLWIALLARLTPMLVAVELRRPVYLLLALNLIAVLRAVLPIGEGVRRVFLTIITLVALAGFGWLTRPSTLRRMSLSKWARLVLLIGSRVGLLLMAFAIIANVLGFVSLARVLGTGTLFSAFFAMTLYLVGRVALLALTLLLESPWAGYLSPDVREAIRLWGRRVLILVAVIVWWTRSEVYVFLLQEGLQSTAASVLDSPIGLGSIQFTLGNVVSVLLILGIGFGLAKGISSVMRSVLVAKFPAQRGMPYAASKVTYYILSVVVVLAAVTAAGVDLNKFTVITGAVGVGVGFGLQDIVKNFASGLILLFERPIRVEDTVEVGGLVGTVRRIGARSSTIVTAQGAEVIVPNSNLTSTQVINWTLSSQQRRIEIPVGVAYGTDPERVLSLLVGVAAGHDGVMTDPGPMAFFMGFGESALNFELRFWSAHQDIWFQLKSDITVGVAKALAEAGIEIPFPQRDLHLRSIDPSIAGNALPAAFVPAAPPNQAEPSAKTGPSPAETSA